MAIMHLYHWFYSNVWGNIVASLLFQLPIWTIGYFKLKKQHSKQHQQLKDHIDHQFTKLTEANTQ